MSTNAPVMFISHGAPTFALSPGKAGRLLRRIGKRLAQVKGIAILSPHWITHHQEISAGESPATFHDFGGFADDLYTISYPAPGDPSLARNIQNKLTQNGISSLLNTERGRDHGVWVPMLHLLPDANIPIIQLSLKHRSSWEEIVNLGSYLRVLREQGIAIIGSGSLTHNLSDMHWSAKTPADYAVQFQHAVRQHILHREYSELIHRAKSLPGFAKSHPTDEHYLPLLFAIGALTPEDRPSVLEGDIVYGSLSMESYFWC